MVRRPCLHLCWTALVYSLFLFPASHGNLYSDRQHAPPKDGVDWDNFGFSLNGVETDAMWVDKVLVGKEYFSSNEKRNLQPMGTLQISPAATVLNYGQALFEGLKAFRRQDGSIALFRPESNAQRMQQGAERFLLPTVPTDVFVQAAEHVVRANSRWIPPMGKGALYLRPILIGTGAALGVAPSHEATFCIYGSPVGNYFKGDLKPIRLQAVRGYSRASPGGTGAVKASGNYAPAFLVQKQIKARGYDEALCLDAVTGECVEEAGQSFLFFTYSNAPHWQEPIVSFLLLLTTGASNFFAYFAHNKTLVTPSLDTLTILPGVTRQSIMELAQIECGCTVLERRLTLIELREADEAFCCGTGAVITPVGCVSVLGKDGEETEVIQFGDGETGPMTRTLFDMLTGIQSGSNAELAIKYSHWIKIVEPHYKAS